MLVVTGATFAVSLYEPFFWAWHSQTWDQGTKSTNETLDMHFQHALWLWDIKWPEWPKDVVICCSTYLSHSPPFQPFQCILGFQVTAVKSGNKASTYTASGRMQFTILTSCRALICLDLITPHECSSAVQDIGLLQTHLKHDKKTPVRKSLCKYEQYWTLESDVLIQSQCAHQEQIKTCHEIWPTLKS